ncbi:unnamed protein product [Euphydryas editha]|uniref:DUF4455 domain-containing protein n=1 Tax=Euphydryas editha TaxID=104508 RepID=A0AAU9TTD4_EUPED|nr:unnamed protein product [Euphydryas editha]
MKQRSLKPKEKRCSCNQTEKEQLVAVAGCSDDLAAVSVLPDNWVPRSSGPILRKFLVEQEKNHEDVLKNIAKEAQSINNDIDEKVRNIAEIMLSDIRQNNTVIEVVIEKCRSNNKPLSIEDRNKALEQLTKLSTQQTEELIKFRQEAFGLERLRADGLRDIFRCNFQRLIAIGYKPPRDLLHDLDEQIYEINHQLLSNCRAYIDLEARLRLQLDELIVHARSKLNALCLCATEIVRGGSSLPWVKCLNFSQKEFDSNINKSQTLKDDSSLITTDFEEIKNNVCEVVETYNTACFKLFKKISEQLDNLYNNITVDRLSAHKSSAEAFDDAVDVISKYPVYNSLGKSEYNIIYTHVTDLQNKFSSLIKCIYETHLILTDLSHIWDNHANRLALVQKFTNLGLEDMQTNQDVLELSNEVNFNIALEQMRCAPDPDKLQQQFDVVTNYISKKFETYCQQREVENTKLEDFMKLSLTMSQILQSEFYCLLDKHPKVTTQPNETSNTPIDSKPYIEEPLLPLRIPLVQLILQTQLQEQEIIECRNSYLESFESICLTIPEILNRHAREWVDKKCSLVNMRSTLKLMSHSVRAERIKAGREVRLTELRFHDSRLNSHLDAVYNLLDRLPIEASEFLAIDAPELYPFCKWINDIKTNIDMIMANESNDSEFKRLKMTSYRLRLLKYRQLFEESLDSAIIEYKRLIEVDVQQTRISNLRFMSRLKLFFEGGKYAAAEVLRSCNALVKAGDALESCFHRTMDALHQRRTQLLALADQQMLPLQRIVEETYKYGAKTAFDKNKLPQNKTK